MANFMGPMAPPQAAPPQPAQLEIRTNPSQRAQFKSFMQGMQVQPTIAPIAPMLPAPMPSPMDQVDIFAPAQFQDGGDVGRRTATLSGAPMDRRALPALDDYGPVANLQRLLDKLLGIDRDAANEGRKAAPDAYGRYGCLLYTSPSPRDVEESRMPSSA